MIGSIIPNRIAVLHNFIAAITFFYTKIVFTKTIMIVFVSLYTMYLLLFASYFCILKGNVAVYKVLNLEMLLYKVRWHVSTVKECNLIARS